MENSLKKKLNKILELQSDVVLKPYAYLEQVSYLIVLKLIDEEGFHGEDHNSSNLIRDNEIYYDQADRYRWSNWIDKEWEMVDFLRDEVIPYMASLESEAQIIHEIFNNAEIQIESADVILNLLSIISNIDFYKLSYKDRVEFYDYLVGQLLKEKDYKLGQYQTPREIAKLLIEMFEPQDDVCIFDPACGSGGFITEYIDYVNRNGHSNERSFKNVSGIDISRSMIRLTLVNLLLRGVNSANIHRADYLKDRGVAEDVLSKQFDLILSHPPSGGVVHSEGVRKNLNFTSKRSEILYLQAIRNQLAPDGFAAVVMPNTILHASMKDYRNLKKEIVNNDELLAVISLPEGTLHPHTSISVNVLVLKRGNKNDRNKVWFFDLNYPKDTTFRDYLNLEFRNKYGKLLEEWSAFKNTNYINPPGLQANSIIKNKNQEPFSWWATSKQIKENDYDLTFNLYKPALKADKKYDDPIALINEIQHLEKNILKKFDELETDLKREIGDE